LRFDFYGQGDSAGATEEVRLEDLFQSIQDGVSELRARSGVRKIKIVALRGSSLLLEQIRSSLGAGVEVLLVEPVYCGREYLENLRGMQKRRWDAYPFKKSLTQTERSEEILGGMVSRELLGAFEALTAPAGSTAHLTSNVDPGWSDFTRIEEIWFSPELSREIEERLFAPGGTP
ncbi:MAG: hypothetical protein ACXVBW_15535, partial [Bdellovibrionota bacterium]